MTAPVLNAGASPVFSSIDENLANPAGVTIATLVVDGSITDADGAVEAIAIEAVDTSLGTWQYSLDAGASWLTIQASLLNSSTNTLGLLLGPTSKIRLIPFGELSGTLSSAITFRAWDQSSGSAGQYVVTTPGSGAFSSASDTASLIVSPVNDVRSFALPNGAGCDYGRGVAVQAGGKIVVAGTSHGASDSVGVMRLNADGSLDKCLPPIASRPLYIQAIFLDANFLSKSNPAQSNRYFEGQI